MRNMLKISLITLFHPIRSMSLLKAYRSIINPLSFIILVATCCLLRIIYLFNVNVIVSQIDYINVNIFFETLKIIVPLLSWVICSYALTSVFSGEAKLKEIFTGTTLALVPYIVFTPLLIAISKVIAQGEIGIYYFLYNLLLFYVGSIIFIAFMTLNNMSLIKAIVLSICSAIGVIVLWGLFVIFVTLVAQVMVFINELIIEFKFLGWQA